ncbi:MAG: hypothetical protein H0T53_07475 [Herpetosiphonaceae bacterium]|nr:hypothetical protein [Herpetosiphonaceae bacterium]
MAKHDITAKYEEERLRAQEQSQLVYLQSQIDELRRQIKDTNGKYSWAMEQSRKSEAVIAQLQGLIDRQTQEQLQTLEGYRRELTALRKEVANSSIKIDDNIKPLRDIQLTMAQQSEHRKQDLQTAQSWFARIELIEQRMNDFDARIREAMEGQRSLTNHIDTLRGADAEVMQDVRKLSEDMQIEKQNLRRQAVEAQQMVVDSRAAVSELQSRIELVDEKQKGLEAEVESLPEQIEFIRAQIPDMIMELKRIERVSTERFLMNQERLEELRSQHNEQLDDLRSTDETHLRQITNSLERIDVWCHEYEAKLSRTQNRLEDVQIAHLGRMQDAERREVQSLSDLLSTFQSRLNIAQAELLEKGSEI